MGAEIDAPINDEKAFRYNFTNEGSVNGKTRFLKNIMGLWILQRIRSELPGSPAFGELMTIGRRAKTVLLAFQSVGQQTTQSRKHERNDIRAVP